MIANKSNIVVWWSPCIKQKKTAQWKKSNKAAVHKDNESIKSISREELGLEKRSTNASDGDELESESSGESESENSKNSNTNSGGDELESEKECTDKNSKVKDIGIVPSEDVKWICEKKRSSRCSINWLRMWCPSWSLGVLAEALGDKVFCELVSKEQRHYATQFIRKVKVLSPFAEVKPTVEEQLSFLLPLLTPLMFTFNRNINQHLVSFFLSLVVILDVIAIFTYLVLWFSSHIHFLEY